MEMTAARQTSRFSAGTEESGSLPPPSSLGLTWRGVGRAAGGYALAAALYVGALALWLPECCSLAEMAARAPIDYALKGALALPVWLVAVRSMEGTDWRWRLAAHAALAPLYVGAWFLLYRGATQALGLGAPGEMSLFGSGIFYVAQFGIFHTVAHVRRIREQAACSARLAELARRSEVAALKAQINPHFLFNTFNSISASVPPEQEKTRAMIAKLGRLMRYALSASEQERVPLSEELRAARLYLSLAEGRFEERLTVRYDIGEDSEVFGTPVPPMIVQPLVENAVQHGIAPLRRGGTVRLSARKAEGPVGEVIEVSVADTGVGTKGAELKKLLEQGTGLRNVHERLVRLYGQGLVLTRRQQDGEGFEVRFQVPLPVQAFLDDERRQSGRSSVAGGTAESDAPARTMRFPSQSGPSILETAP